MTSATPGIAAFSPTATILPPERTIVPFSITGPETVTIRAPRIAMGRGASAARAAAAITDRRADIEKRAFIAHLPPPAWLFRRRARGRNRRSRPPASSRLVWPDRTDAR